MLARFQRMALLGTLLGVLLWAWLWRDASPWMTWAAALTVVATLLGSLALEFLLLATVGRDAQQSAPAITSVLRAWLSESLHATRVFGWRQPFASHAEPDSPSDVTNATRAHTRTRGVLLIHGYLCNRGFWNPWMRALRAQQTPFTAVSLEPVLGSIDHHVQQIEAAVQTLERATGCAPLIVCHSMGGLVARAWLRAIPDAAERCAGLVTIASPHAGTWLAHWSNTPNGRQMRLRSEWLLTLAQDLARPTMQSLLQRTVCWYSDCDNIVFPVRTATLAGADNRFVPGCAHIALAFDPRVMRETLALIEATALKPA